LQAAARNGRIIFQVRRHLSDKDRGAEKIAEARGQGERMSRWGKILVLSLCLLVALLFATPAFAQRDATTSDVKGISRKRSRHFVAVVGGTALGAGLGAAVGGWSAAGKGMLIGGGGANAWYLSKHHGYGSSKTRDFQFIVGNTALVAGLGWALCDCNDGLVAGALIGGGGTAVWQAMRSRGSRASLSLPPPTLASDTLPSAPSSVSSLLTSPSQ
jgi:hypothetical protein